MGAAKTDIPSDKLILELLQHTPTMLLLDEFQTWYDGLTNTQAVLVEELGDQLYPNLVRDRQGAARPASLPAAYVSALPVACGPVGVRSARQERMC
jgi:hypothetical protein